MPNHHLFVLALRCDDQTAESVEKVMLALADTQGGAIPCDWAPDPDTVADDGFHALTTDVAIHDLNPAS